MKEFHILDKMTDEEIEAQSDELIKKIRKMSRLSQRKFCELYHIPHSTLAFWEKRRAIPKPYLIELLYSRVFEDFENIAQKENSNKAK